MKTITTIENQTIFDIAVQYYGNVEAIQEILLLNPQIGSDLNGYNVDDTTSQLIYAGMDVLMVEGHDIDDTTFQLDLAVKGKSQLVMDENSPFIKKNILREINETVTTFEIWQEQ